MTSDAAGAGDRHIHVEEFSGETVNIKREVFYAIQHGAIINDKSARQSLESHSDQNTMN